MSWKSKRHASRWREFAFAYHELIRAIDPALGLQKMIEDWKEIARDLAEPPRKRLYQGAKSTA